MVISHTVAHFFAVSAFFFCQSLHSLIDDRRLEGEVWFPFILMCINVINWILADKPGLEMYFLLTGSKTEQIAFRKFTYIPDQDTENTLLLTFGKNLWLFPVVFNRGKSTGPNRRAHECVAVYYMPLTEENSTIYTCGDLRKKKKKNNERKTIWLFWYFSWTVCVLINVRGAPSGMLQIPVSSMIWRHAMLNVIPVLKVLGSFVQQGF